MTGDELRAWRSTHGITRKQLVLLIACSKRALKQWEQDRRPIPDMLDKLLRIVGSSREAMDQLKWLSLSQAINLGDRVIQLQARSGSHR